MNSNNSATVETATKKSITTMHHCQMQKTNQAPSKKDKKDGNKNNKFTKIYRSFASAQYAKETK